METLRISHVNKFYNLLNKEKFQALNDVNLSFKKGELVSIVGESGSGKSTLMNLIGGLDSDFEGEISVEGESLSKLTEKQLDKYRKNRVGFVFQSFNLIPHLSILENVTIALTLSNVKESEKIEKATKLLTSLGLESQMKKKPSQLSGGQKQRVAIARALINDPEIILADEPTGSLDTGTTTQILKILKNIADSGKLVIMVTHSEKVASISSRVIEISDGKVVKDEKKAGYKISKSKKFKNKDGQTNTKQNFSFWSAIKLSIKNMWASKTKNFFMAFGVAISIASMILMLSFGAGLTSYITTQADSYTSPTVVTVTKKTTSSNSGEMQNQNVMSFFKPNPFSDEDIDTLVSDVNEYIKDKTSYVVKKDELKFGYSAMTGFSQSAKVIWGGNEEDSSTIMYLYTTPPTYNDSHLVSGRMSGHNEIMFSKSIVQKLGCENEEDVLGKKVDFYVKYGTDPNATEINLTDIEITGIVDTSIMSDYLVCYIDYDYLCDIVAGEGQTLEPTETYIITDGQKTTDLINSYISSSEKYAGSVEQRLAEMFNDMLGVIGSALLVIAMISLVVSTIMIFVVLYMSVTERTREIGVLKSIGARRKDIKLIFTSESFLVGVLSGIVGIIFSFILSGVIYLILTSTIGFCPLGFRVHYYVIAMLISVVISMLSGLYPAAKAAKLDPVESLRHE